MKPKHIIGFKHEHVRKDRGLYISLDDTCEACSPNACKNYNYEMIMSQNDYGFEYDYCSILHYNEINSLGCLITTKKPVNCLINGKNVNKIGQREGLSDQDIKEINARYSCKGK